MEFKKVDFKQPGLENPFLKNNLFIPADVPKYEADALISFYNSGNGDNWADNTGWKTDPIVGNWAGITVEGGHVIKVYLDGDAAVLGNIERLKPLTNLKGMSFWSSPVVGNVIVLRAFVNLEELRLRNSKVTGDASIIQYLPNLRGTEDYLGIRLDNTNISTYTQGSIPSLTCYINISNLGLSQTEIDNFLVDMDSSGSTGCPIDVSGNSAPIQTGLDAIASLEGKGCTITYDT